MRAIKAIIALLFAIAGILIGALNQQVVDINLIFMDYQARLGLVLLLCLLSGAVLGGVLASVGLLLRGRGWHAGQPAQKPEPVQEPRA